MPEHKKCPACGSKGEPVVTQQYGFQVCCRNTLCLLRGPSRPVIAEAWRAWDDPSWRTPTWGDRVNELKEALSLANRELLSAKDDLEKTVDTLELTRLERDEWKDLYEELKNK